MPTFLFYEKSLSIVMQLEEGIETKLIFLVKFHKT